MVFRRERSDMLTVIGGATLVAGVACGTESRVGAGRQLEVTSSDCRQEPVRDSP